MRLWSVSLLVAVVACDAAPPWSAEHRKAREIAPAVVFVARSGPATKPDGSAEHPYPTIAEALRAAPAASLIRIAEGEYAEALLMQRTVVLAGAGTTKTRLVPPDGHRGPLLRIQGGARVELREVAIERADGGVSVAEGALRLQSVALRDLTEFAVASREAEVVLLDGELTGIGGGNRGIAIRIDGGSFEMRRSSLRGSGRRAIEIRRARALLERIEISDSALAAVQAVDGAEVTIDGGRFERIGGSALYAGAAKLVVRHAKVSHAEYGAVGYRGAELDLRDSEFSDTRVASVGLVRARGVVDHCLLVRGGSDAAVAITSAPGTVRLVANRIVEPGPLGVHVTQASVVATDNSIAGASLDREGDMGDGIYAIDADLSLERNELRGNAGSGVTTARSRVRLLRNRVSSNGRVGLLLLDRSSASANHNRFEGNHGPGVQIAERSAATLLGNRFSGNLAYDVDPVCGGGGSVDVRSGNSFLGPAEPHRSCD